MKNTSISIDGAGRIILPKELREELAIKPGDTLKLSVQGSSVTLTPDRQQSGLVRKSKALVFSNFDDDILSGETVERTLKEQRAANETGMTSGTAKRNRSS